MRLLQSEIDVTPGTPPNLGARPEGWVGAGAALVEIANAGDLENAYVLRVECDHAYWQPGWVRFDALPPQGDANKPPAGKPDLPGPKNTTLKLHLGNGTTRQAMLSFRLPRTSEARAGVYQLRVVVETAIPGGNATERFTEFPATLIVRPFYDYAIEETPAESRVGRLRRRARFTVRVVNRGNDWLYVDLKAPKSDALALEVPATRLAVPPPEPGAESDRTLPIEAITRRKEAKGAAIRTPLPLEALRVDAPSVPPLSEEAAMGGPALLGTSVLAAETREPAPLAEPAELVYHPPIPGSLLGFGQALSRNLKGLAMAVVGVAALLTAGAVLYERAMHKMNSLQIAEVGRDSQGAAIIPDGGSFTVRGEWLDNAVFELYVQGQNDPAETFASDDKAHVQLTPLDPRKRSLGDVRGRLADARAHVYFAKITPTLRDTVVTKVVARRRLPILGALGILPGNSLPLPIRIGAEPAVATKRDGPHLATSELKPNDPIVLTGSGFGPQGKVTVGGVEVGGVKWSDTRIVAPVDSEYGASGQKFNVVVTFADKTSEEIKDLVVKTPPPVDDGTTGGTGSTGGGTGSTGDGTGTTSGGNAVSDPIGVPPPSATVAATGYGETLQAFGGNSLAWRAAANEAGQGTTVESKALQAYALASTGRADKAQALIGEYLDDAALKRLSEREQAYVGAAFSRILEVLKPRGLSAVASNLSGLCSDFTTSRGASFNPGDAFPYLAYASFLARHPELDLGSPASSLIPLRKAGDKATDAERQAAQRLQSPS